MHICLKANYLCNLEKRPRMTPTDWIGSIGVTILLLAFFLNLYNVIKKESFGYLLLNVVGAALACYASILLHYMPFIILEAIWTLVSAAGIVRLMFSHRK
jgi:hypothetical protein